MQKPRVAALLWWATSKGGGQHARSASMRYHEAQAGARQFVEKPEEFVLMAKAKQVASGTKEAPASEESLFVKTAFLQIFCREFFY